MSAPTESPPSSTMCVMGKPKPHIVATSAMMSTAVRWEMTGWERSPGMGRKRRALIHPIALDVTRLPPGDYGP